MVTIEEQLLAGDVDTTLTVAPFLIFSEVLEGARRPLCFLEALGENFDLIGGTGEILRFLRWDTHLAGYNSSYDTESEIESSGMPAEDIGSYLGVASVTCSTVFWGASSVSDILKENYPNIDFLRMAIRDAGKSVMEQIDEKAYDVLAAASGVNTVSASSIAYSVVLDAIAELEKNSWFTDPANPPYLIIAPWAKKTLMADSTFVSTERYTTADISKMVSGEIGKYAGCRVLISPLLEAKETAWLIYPSDTEHGVVAMVAWKRRLTVKTDYEVKYARTYFNVSARAKAVVVQPKGIVKITISPTP